MATPAARTINIPELLANSKVGPLQKRVFILCALCLIIDGFDVQAMGYVAPAVFAELKLPPPALGSLLAAANFGVLIGSLVFSPLADRIGRRPVLIGATLFFALLTLATAFAQTLNQLWWLRLIAGIGMGCIIPNATALVGEFSPAARRVTLMMTITVGFTAGAALGGFVAADEEDRAPAEGVDDHITARIAPVPGGAAEQHGRAREMADQAGPDAAGRRVDGVHRERKEPRRRAGDSPVP